MDNNTILRQLRYIFNYGDDQMILLFGLGGLVVSRAKVSNWLKKENDQDYELMTDRELSTFLNGLIIQKRGKKEGVEMIPEDKLNNNLILRKLKIALKLTTEDIGNIIAKSDDRIQVSQHEITALFRNPKQSQFRYCKDQFMRKFLHGLQMTYRP